MAKIKISKIAKDLNISVTTVIESLQKHGITVDDTPNTRLDESAVDLLMKEFKSDKDLKNRSEQITNERKESRVKAAAETKPAAEPAHADDSRSKQMPHILGKLELDAKAKAPASSVSRARCPCSTSTSSRRTA